MNTFWRDAVLTFAAFLVLAALVLTAYVWVDTGDPFGNPSPISEETAEHRVERGAELLNKHFGSNEWKERLNPDSLNMRALGTSSVLPRLFGSYSEGKRVLGIDDARSYGFTGTVKSDLTVLTEAWRKALAHPDN